MSDDHMTLGEVIAYLRTRNPEQCCSMGFDDAYSYRGTYAYLAFHPCGTVTVGEMLAVAESAVGKIFHGYKGGAYVMGADTPTHVAEWGNCGDDDELTLARIKKWCEAGWIAPEELGQELEKWRDWARRWSEGMDECSDAELRSAISEMHATVCCIAYPIERSEPDEPKTFGQKLRRARLNAGVTMGDVARNLDTSVVYVSDVERDRVVPSPHDGFCSYIAEATLGYLEDALKEAHGNRKEETKGQETDSGTEATEGASQEVTR